MSCGILSRRRFFPRALRSNEGTVSPDVLRWTFDPSSLEGDQCRITVVDSPIGAKAVGVRRWTFDASLVYSFAIQLPEQPSSSDGPLSFDSRSRHTDDVRGLLDAQSPEKAALHDLTLTRIDLSQAQK